MLLEVIIVHDSNVSLSTNACIYSKIHDNTAILPM